MAKKKNLYRELEPRVGTVDPDLDVRYGRTIQGITVSRDGIVLLLVAEDGSYSVTAGGHTDPATVKLLNALDPNGEYALQSGVLKRNGEPMPNVVKVNAEGEVTVASSLLAPIRGIASTDSQVDEEGRTVLIVTTDGTAGKGVAAQAARRFFEGPVTLVKDDGESVFVFTRAGA